ncbi:MAG: methylenetetrahydrofolate--tRNA-(uracil(54)-C(5))-methyltransferase (FADH(2)-oxidizing) TrmFO [Coriobacteriales bacterium]|jgi:methylenetetrahydrofolate--tRNA-(uracil-5-)-methyltransferase|nr:methylenetetrahydrofolate--tRNA-(uracil(54)-C(5))-methyltransferase (FADH(2)-oxidizing) TrmFO [Coriobacteriales bacterium]
MTDTDKKSVLVIGGGLAGSEAAWQLAERGVSVRLYEMRPVSTTPAHQTGYLAELVCSNSFKSLALPSAAAALKQELALMGCFVLKEALEHRVLAGMALAVEREAFAAAISQKLAAHPNIELVHEEITSLAPLVDAASSQQIIVATGPLTSDALAEDIAQRLGREYLAFFDAAAPILEAESLNRQKLVRQSRFDKGEGEYLNALLSREQYLALVEDLTKAERVVLKSFEKRELFTACQPVEEVARSGVDALRYGALKPIGLTDPATGKRPYAAVQLRAENTGQSAWNLVGFQTNLSFAAQEEVIRRIPGFEKASFVRHGVMHRNTFINSPEVLGRGFELPSQPRVRFAGQITGTEGYTEALASGFFAALNAYASLSGMPAVTLPDTSTFGALVAYATSRETRHYQPLHVNYGLMPPLSQGPRGKRERYTAYAERAIAATKALVHANPQLDFLPSYELPELDYARQEQER